MDTMDAKPLDEAGIRAVSALTFLSRALSATQEQVVNLLGDVAVFKARLDATIAERDAIQAELVKLKGEDVTSPPPRKRARS